MKFRKYVRPVRTVVPPVRAVHPQQNVVFLCDLTHQIEGADGGQQFLFGVKRDRWLRERGMGWRERGM